MNLVITFDYELYGDGSGNVFDQMITPTNKILEICDKEKIKTTIFFEVLEYIKLKEQWTLGNSMGYQRNPIIAIEKQLQDAALKGHDIQLHIHPQWQQAIYESNTWKVDFDNWRLGDFNIGTSYSIENLIRDCKNTLESIIHQVVPSYKCTSLRAGGYNVLPSKSVYDAMVKLDLKVDSSVYPGGYESGNLSRYDYREASLNKDFWEVLPENFSKETQNSKVLEIPVFALPQRRFLKFNIQRVLSALQNRNSAVRALKSKTHNTTLTDKLSYIIKREAFTWDFCLFNYGLHKKFFIYIEKYLKSYRNNFVIIGHPKSFTKSSSFEKMIKKAKKKGYTFSTLQHCYETYSKRL